ncbi:hypothetical protein MLD38_014720 [Melastoma candidum]|uniref:Uncharacterized protein n=1 Tax=Melastoma candidum TaxID=119954 RepID=A0ACB9RDS8_9MYRT|nr:hypothetical protein MLD38_014720 [Melastoma candidum]
MSPRIAFLAVLVLVVFPSSQARLGSPSRQPDFLQAECLTVPNSQFTSSLLSTIDVLRQVTSIVSQFAGFFGDFRLSNAVTDCLDLLDSSVDELSWSVSAAENPKRKDNGTGDLGSDLRAWLSAALANQDTCMEGFDGTSSGIVKGLVSGGISQITSLVEDLLTMVNPRNRYGIPSGNRGFPSWVDPRDMKLLMQASGASNANSSNAGPVVADVVVAQDGSGNFTKIQDAIAAAPDYRADKRFVIYVKRGIYNENVEIKRKKWNIMMFGDGMGATVISAHRNYVDGWTTFRTATFAVSGRGFMARDLTIENTSGPQKHQAVALSSAQAVNFTVAQFIEGNSWLPATGVAYTAGFGN